LASGWSFSSLDTEGLSGGLISAWSPHIKVIDMDFLPSCIVIQDFDIFLNSSFKLVNIYGRILIIVLSGSGSTSLESITLKISFWGEDLNFTLSLNEVWGVFPRQDSLEYLFSHWMEAHHIFYLAPPKLSQTWCNGRKGDGLIAKRIDRFLVS
jgi:hypothetical protein